MSSKSRLELHFANKFSPSLYRTIFYRPGVLEPTVGLRGQITHSSGIPFAWGLAAQALSLLFTKAKEAELEKTIPILPLLEGPSLSPAGTLGRLITKRTSSWLHDLFGTDSSGRSLLSRIIVLGNSRGKRHGPISATLRAEYLSPTDIKIFIDGEDVSNDLGSIKRLSRSLLAAFDAGNISHLSKKRTEVDKARLAANNLGYGYMLTAVGET